MPEKPKTPGKGFAKKVGPLPLGIWVLLLAGTVGLVIWLRRVGSDDDKKTLLQGAPGGNYTFGPSYYMFTGAGPAPGPLPGSTQQPPGPEGEPMPWWIPDPNPLPGPPMCPPGMEPIGGLCVPIEKLRNTPPLPVPSAD